MPMFTPGVAAVALALRVTLMPIAAHQEVVDPTPCFTSADPAGRVLMSGREAASRAIGTATAPHPSAGEAVLEAGRNCGTGFHGREERVAEPFTCRAL